MKGAIIGDICGSVYEFNNVLTKDFGPLVTDKCSCTDDTIMTLAVTDWLFRKHYSLPDELVDIRDIFKAYGQTFPDAGYGRKFFDWVLSDDMEPYNSCGNGAAMRISPVGWYSKTEEQVKELAYEVTKVTHNHPEGIKGAECIAMMIFKAKNGATKDELRDLAGYYYSDNIIFGQSLDEMRDGTKGERGKEICQFSVPQAINC